VDETGHAIFGGSGLTAQRGAGARDLGDGAMAAGARPHARKPQPWRAIWPSRTGALPRPQRDDAARSAGSRRCYRGPRGRSAAGQPVERARSGTAGAGGDGAGSAGGGAGGRGGAAGGHLHERGQRGRQPGDPGAAARAAGRRAPCGAVDDGDRAPGGARVRASAGAEGHPWCAMGVDRCGRIDPSELRGCCGLIRRSGWCRWPPRITSWGNAYDLLRWCAWCAKSAPTGAGPQRRGPGVREDSGGSPGLGSRSDEPERPQDLRAQGGRRARASPRTGAGAGAVRRAAGARAPARAARRWR
jgi:hypothetical protein